MSVDGDNNGGESQALMRFTQIFEDQGGPVPRSSSIQSATLVISAFDPGTITHVYRMRVPWPRDATWNRMINGVQRDGIESERTFEGMTFGEVVMDRQQVTFDVTESIRAWRSGAPNYGWVFINTGPNGWDFYASEAEDPTLRPKLLIDYSPRTQETTTNAR